MLVTGEVERKDGDADDAPTGLPRPMSCGVLEGKKPWYHKDIYFPGVPRPPPGSRAATAAPQSSAPIPA